MVRPIESHAHVSAGCARCRTLCCRGRCRSPARGASWNSAGGSSDKTHQSTFQRQHRSATQGYHQAAIMRLRGSTEAWRHRCFLERHWRPRLRQAFNLLGQFQIDMSIKQHIDARAQISRPDVLIAQVCVRDFSLVKRISNPSNRICIRPRHPDTNTRRRTLVVWHIRRRGYRHEIETKFVDNRLDRLPYSILCGNDPRSRRKPCASCFKFVFGNFDFEIREPVACGQKRFLSRILQEKYGSSAREVTSNARRLRQIRQL